MKTKRKQIINKQRIFGKGCKTSHALKPAPSIEFNYELCKRLLLYFVFDFDQVCGRLNG